MARVTFLGQHFTVAAIFSVIAGLLTSCDALTAVKLEDGHYTGLVVAISPTVPETSKDAIISGIKRMLTAANDYLYVASKKALVIAEATILVPKSWNGPSSSSSSSDYGVATHQTWRDADVRIGEPNPQHGDTPYTLQPGVCAQPGSYIHIVPEFFVNYNDSLKKYGDHGRVFIHEWAHYRYGVFDEYGYPGDPLYPAVYSYGDQLRPTACSDIPLVGQISDECSSESPNSPRCHFRPDPNQAGVNSSIMSYQFLPNVSHFCDDHTHNPLAPTRQNAFCGRRSVWEVMRTHADFTRTSSSPVAYRSPTIRVVKPTESRYVLLLDCSSNMNDFQRMSFVRSAAVKFIEDVLPDGTWLSLISFGAQAEILKPLTQLSRATRKGFTNTVPRVTCNSPDRNLVAAIRKAIKELDQHDHGRTDGTIITVTNGITDDAQAYPQLKSELQRRKVRAINIIYPPMPDVTALPSLADATSGRNYIVAEVAAGQRGNSSTLAQLASALEDAVVSQSGNPLEDRLIIYQKVHPANAEEISGHFVVDSSLGKKLQVTISYYNRDNIFGVTLVSPRRTYGVDDYDDDASKKTIVFAIKEDDALTGTWEYNVRGQHDFQPITVTVTSQPRQGAPITLECWTNVGNKGINASETPLIIHAALFKGGQPVVGAKVRAVVERPKVNSSHSSVEIELLDNGSGVPDATKNDGVYSRYFTQYGASSFGFYAITVWADDDDGKAQLVGGNHARFSRQASGVVPKDPNASYCCGSEAPTIATVVTGQFQRYTTAPSVLVTSTPPFGLDVFPPGTVTDLKVEDMDSITGHIVLKWTAPGDDYDTGILSSYEVRYLHDYEALMQNLEYAPVIPDYIGPMPPGSVQEFGFLAPDGSDKHYYFVLRAIDKAGHKSGLSNVVWTYVPPKPTTTTPAEPTTPSGGGGGGGPGSSAHPTEPSSAKRPLLTAELIAIIGGCALAFLLIVAIIVFLLCASRRRRKLEESKMTHHTLTPVVHGLDLVKPPLIISEPTSFSKQPESLYGGSTKGGVYFTPASSISPRQFIPASEILSHHEKQRIETPYIHVASNNGGHLTNGTNYYDNDADSVVKVSNTAYSSRYSPIHDRMSISSSKPSSYASQQTTEVTSSTGYGQHALLRPADHNGYINTSYEDGSENSAETARLQRPGSVAYAPLVPPSTATTVPRRVQSESQV